MANELVKLHELTDAGFEKIVTGVNALVVLKNRMEIDDDLKLWVAWNEAAFEAAGCSAVVAAACVDAMTGLKASYLTVKAQVDAGLFPANAV